MRGKMKGLQTNVKNVGAVAFSSYFCSVEYRLKMGLVSARERCYNIIIPNTALGEWMPHIITTQHIIMLEIKNLHASVEGKEILRGVNLTIRDGEVHVLMGPNGSGKSTLSNVLVGNPKYEVTEGSITFNGKDLLALAPEDRAHEGIFMSFQAPTEIPGVSMTNFMRAALNAKRKYFGQEPIGASEFLKLLKEKRKLVGLDAHFMSRGVNEGFSGGERKRNEIFQMAVLEPLFSILDETDSGLDVDALRIVAEGFNMLRTPKTSAMVITHYQRMLDYLKPDFVHVLVKGRVVKEGTAQLGYEIEEKGFDWIVNSIEEA